MAEEQTLPEITILNFADSKIPEFKEVSNKDFILYGEDNYYPEYLTNLYNKSAKHNAIINGKCNYILGSGFQKRNEGPKTFSQVNRTGESLNELCQKTVKDNEIYGGFRWIIIWDLLGKSFEIWHDDFHKFRRSKDGDGFWYKNNWKNSKEEAIFYPDFNENDRKGAQVFEYNEYRPGCNIYPLPGYVGSCNYIETDIEISKYNLSCIRNGMMPSKMIQVYTGGTDLGEEKKGELEKRWKKKFAGSENGGRFILIWSPTKEKNVEIEDLSATESDKLFDQLNKTCQQEIFTGHQVVSPMLFGIKTEGQLGGTNELRVAYEIFINTYAKPKQYNLEKIVNYFGALGGYGNDYFIEQLDPIGIIIPDSLIESSLKPEEIREKLGLKPLEVVELGQSQKIINALSSVSPLVATKILDNLTQNEIRGLANMPSIEGGDTIPSPVGSSSGQPNAPAAGPNADGLENETLPITVNENIKNLTAKQHQQILRIIRQVENGKLTEAAARMLLKSGYGLTDDDVNELLGITPEVDTDKFASEDVNVEVIIGMFNSCGDLKKDFHIIKSKKVKFSSDEDAMEDELNFVSQAFKATGVLVTEADILDLIDGDKRITPDLIAEALDTTPEYVTSKIAALVKKGLLKIKEVTIGTDVVIERTLTKPLKDIIKTIDGDPSSTEISIKYSYEGPDDDRNRPFCAKMLKLDRLYSRFEIESISQKLGYSVFDRRGGFWRHKDGIITPYCRHHWQSHIVVKKGKES